MAVHFSCDWIAASDHYLLGQHSQVSDPTGHAVGRSDATALLGSEPSVGSALWVACARELS
jgi:hypothetical protein